MASLSSYNSRAGGNAPNCIRGIALTFRYIGSKARLVEPLALSIRPFQSDGARFVDAFAGTGAVASLAADAGWPVWVNDALASATTMSIARLLSSAECGFERLGGYAAAIETLNGLAGVSGYFHVTYSPASAEHDADGIARMYLTDANAKRLDAIRRRIAKWREDGEIDEKGEHLLLADLIGAVNRVANIAGTYGCFLSRWQSNALRELMLAPRELRKAPVDWRASTCNAEDIAVGIDDLVYIDPPYTKRQYASYYHILESIVLNDAPIVEGVSGLRPWQQKSSEYCYKRRALGALVALVKGIRSGRALISYSSDGHVPLDDLVEALTQSGQVTVSSIHGIGRYRPNRAARDVADTVTEYVISYRRRLAIGRLLPASAAGQPEIAA